MIRTIGMIGAGNMGSAILRGIVEAEYVRASQIIAFDTNRKRMRELEEDLPGVQTASDCLQVAEQADLIILAVKPTFVKEVIREIRGSLHGKSVLSIAAGWTVGMLEKELNLGGICSIRFCKIKDRISVSNGNGITCNIGISNVFTNGISEVYTCEGIKSVRHCISYQSISSIGVFRDCGNADIIGGLTSGGVRDTCARSDLCIRSIGEEREHRRVVVRRCRSITVAIGHIRPILDRSVSPGCSANFLVVHKVDCIALTGNIVSVSACVVST